MGNIIIYLFRTDKQALALFIQAAATIMIGLLAWTAANGQNRIAEKSARKELFKLRYENLYQEVNLMFEKCNELVCEYDDIIYSHSKKAKKKNKITIQDIQSRYFEINEEFNKKMQFNQFLIKPKDFDKLETFCEEYLLEVKKYLWDETDDKICKNYEVATRYSEHRNVIQKILEPYVEATIMVPTEYIGPIMELCQNKRGSFVGISYIEESRASIRYDIPLSEIVYDFFDRLKSSTRGYASLDYTLSNYRESNLVKLDILLNGEKIDALSIIVHKDFAYRRGRALTQKLRGLIPRQQFEIPIQAAVNSKIIARENVAALRKDVLAKCYGGDISRKKKLLEKQKEGKKRMKQVGSVEIPQEAFLAVLQLDDEK